MAVKVSVLVPMYRIGGFDVVCDSLAGQTMAASDFELVVADAIFERRHPLIEERLRGYSYDIVHLPPNGGVTLSDYSRAINSAVIAARGELIVIQSDYTWLAPDCLEAHWRAYEKSPRACHMLDNHCTELPELAPGFRGYGPNWEAKPYVTDEERTFLEGEMTKAAAEYERDLNAGSLDSLMWTIFREPLTWEAVQKLRVTRSHEKQGKSLDPNWCSLKNEGIPTEAFLAANGLDEDMDGSHLYQDQEFAWRAAAKGYRWTTAPGGLAYMVNPRALLYCKRLTRPMRGGDAVDSNEARMYRKRRTGEAVNPSRDLRSERDTWRALEAMSRV